MWNIDWITGRFPTEEDIKKQAGNDLFWVVLTNLEKEQEVTPVNWNKNLKMWEVRPGEIVTHWGYWKTPEGPTL